MMFLSQKITAAFNLTVHGALPVSDLLQISPKKSGAAEPHQQSDKGTKMPWLHRRSPTSCLRGWFNVRYFRTGIQGRGLNMVTWFYMILRSTKQYMGIWSDIWRICQRGPSAGLPFLASRQGGHDRGIDQLTGDHRGDQCVDAEHQQDHLRVRKWKWHLCGRCNSDFGAESSSRSCSNPPKKGCPRYPKMMFPWFSSHVFFSSCPTFQEQAKSTHHQAPTGSWDAWVQPKDSFSTDWSYQKNMFKALYDYM